MQPLMNLNEFKTLCSTLRPFKCFLRNPVKKKTLALQKAKSKMYFPQQALINSLEKNATKYFFKKCHIYIQRPARLVKQMLRINKNSQIKAVLHINACLTD